MSCCNCGQPKRLCRCPKGKSTTPQRAYIAECTDCDPCRPCESMVKICSFVAPTLTEGQKFRNSFVYNQEDDSVYYISDDGTPTRFGSSPMFIDNFNPDDKKIPRQTVYDFANNKAYVFNAEGEYIVTNLNISQELEGKQDKLTAGDNIIIENNVISTTSVGPEAVAVTISNFTTEEPGRADTLEETLTVTIETKYTGDNLGWEQFKAYVTDGLAPVYITMPGYGEGEFQKVAPTAIVTGGQFDDELVVYCRGVYSYGPCDYRLIFSVLPHEGDEPEVIEVQWHREVQ